MAAITRVKARFCSPPGYEVNDTCVLGSAVTAGDLLTLNGTLSGGSPVMVVAPAGTVDPDGIALQDGYSGQGGFSYGVEGEMDGWSGMTPGNILYPSASVAGGLDTTKPTGATSLIKAITATRIRYRFV